MDQETLAQIGRPLMNCLRCGAPLAARAGKHPTVFVQGPVPPPPPGQVQPPTDADATQVVTAPASPDQLHRLDLCTDCWPLERERLLSTPGANTAAAPRIVGFWMTRRTPPKPRTHRARPSRAALLRWWDACWASAARRAAALVRKAISAAADQEQDAAAESASSAPSIPAPEPSAADRVLFIRAHLAALILMRHGALRWTATERCETIPTLPEILSFRRTGTQTPVRVAAYLPGDDEELDALANEVDAHMNAFLENPITVLDDDAPADEPSPESDSVPPTPEATVA